MRIIIIDDDRLVCTSLKTILQSDPEIKVIAIGNSGEEAIALYEELSPDILLMDIQMKGLSGLDAGEQILNKHTDARILFLTTFSDSNYIVKALHIGAKGYLIKQNIETIAPALKAVMAGQNVFGNEIVSKLPFLIHEEESNRIQNINISERENEIICLVAQGFSNKEIADTLYLSEGTIRNYLSTILDKLGLRDRTQLAVYYYKQRK